MTDHLARLCFDGPGSDGYYTPRAFSLRLAGVQQPVDHVVYLHEVHHAALNDVTAWGSALHVYARLPADAARQFRPLLDACRTTHESLATFASVQIASARHGDLDGVLAAYPSYVPLYDATKRLLTTVHGANRRQLAVSALARLCMQAPVLEEIAAAGLDAFRLAAIRQLDTPDGRWSWFLRQGPPLLAAAATTADGALVAAFGRAALDSDRPASDLYASTDRSHDHAWEHWEESAYEQLRAALSAAGARTISFNGHQDGSAALLELVTASHGDIGLRAAMPDELRHDDAALASSVLQQVRHDLSGAEPYRAVLLPPADIARAVEILADRPVVEGRPAMIVDARPRKRLTALYRWPRGTPPEALRAPGEPVVAVRVMVDDGTPGSAVGHVVLPVPDDLAAVSERWPDTGLRASCVSASCLADVGWMERWLPEITRLGPMFVLVDVEPDRFVPAWARDGREVNAVGLQVSDTGGQRTALAFTVDQSAWWLVVADDVTARLMAEYLRGWLGTGLRSDPAAFDQVRAAATVVVSHLLATESFVSFDALGTADAADPLDAVLGRAEEASQAVERAELESIAHTVSTVPAGEFIEAGTLAPGLSWDDGQARPAGYFEIHNRHWWIDLTDAGNRQHLLTVITAAVLVDALRLDLSTSWVTRVVPALLVTYSVTRDDAGLHLDLVRRVGPPPLPPHLADTVHPDDYATFAAAVEAAAAVLASSLGHTITFSSSYAR